MPDSAFYDAGLLRQLATNLFYGWGYNFYRLENQLRADDQMIRTKAANLLGAAVASVSRAEADYRREFLPPPSRQHPRPNPEAVSTAQVLERLGREIGLLEALLQQLPAPENDRMTQRYRNEAHTLATLAAQDEQLVGQCELLRSTVTNKNATSLLEDMAKIEAGLEAIRSSIQRRQAVLLDRER